ncbi:MAG: hypothetical protein RJA98_236 [Pseudomonadota bacterium]
MGRADVLRVLLALPSVGPFPLYLRTSARPITAPTTTSACVVVACHHRFRGALCRIRFAQVKEETAAGRRGTRSKADAAQRASHQPRHEQHVPATNSRSPAPLRFAGRAMEKGLRAAGPHHLGTGLLPATQLAQLSTGLVPQLHAHIGGDAGVDAGELVAHAG